MTSGLQFNRTSGDTIPIPVLTCSHIPRTR